MKTNLHDVFLSYNRADRAEAREIKEVLESYGLNVYFDENVPPTGLELDAILMKRISNSRCFAMLHGGHCLGDTQMKEADYAGSLVTDGLDFKTVVVEQCTSGPGSCRLPSYRKHFTIEGSRFRLIHLLVAWVSQRLYPLGTYTLYGVGKTERNVEAVRIPQPDISRIKELDWQTYGALVERLKDQIRARAMWPQAVFGINEGGSAVGAILAGLQERIPIGYLSHEGGHPDRVVRSGHVALPALLPKEPGRPIDVLLVDTEMKTGGALELVVPALRKHYQDVALKISIAVLFAQLSKKYWKDPPPNHSRIAYGDLLAADRIGSLGLEDIVIGGLFGEGRLDPPLGVR